MNASKRIATAAAAGTTLIGCSQLIPATAQADLHNITYIARVDGVAPGSQATFVINGGQTNVAALPTVPGSAFQANTVLPDPNLAGMRVAVRWPYSANVHCEIDVDDHVAIQLDQFVRPTAANSDPMNGVLQCGAPLPT
jgi:hypothetical protein